MNILEGKPVELEGRIFVTQRVNSQLDNMIDRQYQYSRRPCLLVKDIREPSIENDRDVDDFAAILEKETGIGKDIILANVDKTNSIGRVENGKQVRIVKFTSDHFKEISNELTVYYYHATYEFQRESTLYSLPECQETSCSQQNPYLKFK